MKDEKQVGGKAVAAAGVHGCVLSSFRKLSSEKELGVAGSWGQGEGHFRARMSAVSEADGNNAGEGGGSGRWQPLSGRGWGPSAGVQTVVLQGGLGFLHGTGSEEAVSAGTLLWIHTMEQGQGHFVLEFPQSC